MLATIPRLGQPELRQCGCGIGKPERLGTIVETEVLPHQLQRPVLIDEGQHSHQEHDAHDREHEGDQDHRFTADSR